MLLPPAQMLKRKYAGDGCSAASSRQKTAPSCQRTLNSTDFLTLEPLPDWRWDELDLVFDTDEEHGTTVFLRSSLVQLAAAAEREGIEAINPFTHVPLSEAALRQLAKDGANAGVAPPADALRDLAYPNWASTKQLIVDVCIRLGLHGHFLKPHVLWEQRTGRMKRIHQATVLLFRENFTRDERHALAPPHGELPSALGWASWAAWGQRAMLALAACAGERSRSADARLRKRGATMAIAAISLVVPDVRQEFGGALSIQASPFSL